jgi:hypothetical protein
VLLRTLIHVATETSPRGNEGFARKPAPNECIFVRRIKLVFVRRIDAVDKVSEQALDHVDPATGAMARILDSDGVQAGMLCRECVSEQRVGWKRVLLLSIAMSRRSSRSATLRSARL